MTFCPRCGRRLEPRDEGGRLRPTCGDCGFVDFGTRFVGVGGVVVRGDAVLLARRLLPPVGAWAIPGGYVETDETFSEAVVREVLEETGVLTEVGSVVSVRSVAYGSRHDTYVVFALRHVDGEPVADGIENDEARFFHRDELDDLTGLTPFSKTVAVAVLDQLTGLRQVPYSRPGGEPADCFLAQA